VIPEEGQVVIQPAKVDERDFSNGTIISVYSLSLFLLKLRFSGISD
jgi:hypothetical protein